jgi:hypothetical protein
MSVRAATLRRIEDAHRFGAFHDEHGIKLAYSCWREWQRSGDDLYRRAASVRVAHAQSEAAR